MPRSCPVRNSVSVRAPIAKTSTASAHAAGPRQACRLEALTRCAKSDPPAATKASAALNAMLGSEGATRFRAGRFHNHPNSTVMPSWATQTPPARDTLRLKRTQGEYEALLSEVSIAACLHGGNHALRLTQKMVLNHLPQVLERNWLR